MNNKWRKEKCTFDINPLPEHFTGKEGIIPMNMVMDTSIGTETALLLIDRTPFIYDLKKVRPFVLNLKSGLVRTSHGPLLFLLFHVPDPIRKNVPFVTIDAHVNPLDRQHLMIWKDLAQQSHWHLVLVDSAEKVVDAFEFENSFGLGETLDAVQTACENMRMGSFDDVKIEFSKRYSITDLYNM